MTRLAPLCALALAGCSDYQRARLRWFAENPAGLFGSRYTWAACAVLVVVAVAGALMWRRSRGRS